MLNETAENKEKSVQLRAYSASETRSARMVRTQMLTPEQPRPCNARPKRRSPNVLVGAPVHIAEPMVIITIVAWRVR